MNATFRRKVKSPRSDQDHEDGADVHLALILVSVAVMAFGLWACWQLVRVFLASSAQSLLLDLFARIQPIA
jgi:hypothetical protein